LNYDYDGWLDAFIVFNEQGDVANDAVSKWHDHDANDAVLKRGESFQHYQQATARPRLFSQPHILLSRHQST
jgi:hypothetical protein